MPDRCGCLEGWLRFVDGFGRETGEIIPLPQRHDCRYVERRNALIPLAERVADIGADRDLHPDVWDAQFLLSMDELAKKARVAGLL
jgi:hypothetical protein